MIADRHPGARRLPPWLLWIGLLLLVLGLLALSVMNVAYVTLLVVVTDIVVGRVATVHSPLRSGLVAVVAVVVQLIATVGGAVPSPLNWLVIAIFGVVTAWVIGLSLRQRRQYAVAQSEQAEIRAVQAERLRIARELHDMIAHSFGVISVQAGMGRRVIDTQPEEARNALAVIEETSRDTAAALRRMLGTLRRSDPGSGPELRDPAPGLADLDALVTRAAQAGVRVEVRWAGTRAPLPPEIDLSAYRIIQESVTNVIRHAGVDRCDVVVTQHAGDLTIDVTDAGRGGQPHFGYGLSGMRERVSLLDGRFEAGPAPHGGFRIQARIPLPALSGQVR